MTAWETSLVGEVKSFLVMFETRKIRALINLVVKHLHSVYQLYPNMRNNIPVILMAEGSGRSSAAR